MSRIRVESPTPVNNPSPPVTTQLIQPLTRTPSKRRRERGLSNVLANPDSTNSAVTKKVTTPRRPTVSCRLTLKQVEAAQKEEWEAEWHDWVLGHLWAKDKNPNYKHPPGTTTIYRRNAMNSFFVNQDELDTLPYQEFPNRYNCAHPIRSYTREDVRTLACRKHAMLAGLHKQGLALKELLRRGEKLQAQMYDPPAHPVILHVPEKLDCMQLRRCDEHPESTALVPPGSIVPKNSMVVSVISVPVEEVWTPPVWQRAHLSGSPTISDFDPDDVSDTRSCHRLVWPMSP